MSRPAISHSSATLTGCRPSAARAAATASSVRRSGQEARRRLCHDPPGDPDPRPVPESSMRLAIFDHVHGQVGRLSACLEAVARTDADELWCLGDAIDGLSARPPELTVACVRAINDVCTVKLPGNHEAWALQDQSLPRAAADVIACWGVAAQRDGILAVHGSPHNPL